MSFLKNLVKGVLGMDDSQEKALRAAAQAREAELQRLQQNQKLNAANEMQDVTQIDSGVLFGDTGVDNRRKKRQTGSSGSTLGLNV